jgi:hypothetical protein
LRSPGFSFSNKRKANSVLKREAMGNPTVLICHSPRKYAPEQSRQGSGQRRYLPCWYWNELDFRFRDFSGPDRIFRLI